MEHWNETGIRSLAAAEKEAAEHKEAAAEKARRQAAGNSGGPGAARRTSFHNFEQRPTAGGSWDELEVYRPAAKDKPEPAPDPEAEKEQEDWQQLLQSFRKNRRKNA